jgi:hypothetical protein
MLSGRLQGFIPQKLAHFEEHILTLHTVRPVAMAYACLAYIPEASEKQPTIFSHSSGEFHFFEQSITHERLW